MELIGYVLFLFFERSLLDRKLTIVPYIFNLNDVEICSIITRLLT
jgi:hypothetical protein